MTKIVKYTAICKEIFSSSPVEKEKISRERAFHKKKKKPGLKFNPGLALTDVRTTGPR